MNLKLRYTAAVVLKFWDYGSMSNKMKDIKTSNYSRKGNDPHAIAISATVPPYYTGKRLDILAPTWQLVEDIIEGRIDQQGYDKAYIDLLVKRNLTGQKVLDMLPNKCFLLCYESPTDRCHRRLLADWVYKQTGFEIPEWKNPEEEKQANQDKVIDGLLDF